MILHDVHAKGCTCSYCGNDYDKPLRYGLNIPIEWRAFNAWFVIKYWRGRYLRFTHGQRWLKRGASYGDKQ